MHAGRQKFPSIAELEGSPYEIHCQFMPFEFLGDAGVVHGNGCFLQKVHSVCAANAHFVHQLQRWKGCGNSRKMTSNSFRASSCMSYCQRRCHLCRMLPWVVLNTVGSRGMLHARIEACTNNRLQSGKGHGIHFAHNRALFVRPPVGRPRRWIKVCFACGVATQMASAAHVCMARKLTATAVSRTIGYS